LSQGLRWRCPSKSAAELSINIKGEDVRAYTESVRAMNAKSSGPVSNEEIEAWATWALAQADPIDPMLSRRFLEQKPEPAD
jgi:hypothetical protein